MSALIRDYIPFNIKEGLIGLELECEFDKNLAYDQIIPKGWRIVNDGSLRGINGEFILRQPAKLERLNKYIDSIYAYFKQIDNIPLNSENCSVHVHFNCKDLTFKDLQKIATLYYYIEPIILNYCGNHRQGNEFCLQSSEVLFSFQKFIEFLTSGKMANFDIDHKYTAFNFSALNKFGSIEFRSMEYFITKNKLIKWIDFLCSLFNVHNKYTSANDIIKDININGLEKVSKKIFKENADIILDRIDKIDLYDSSLNAEVLSNVKTL